jgi:hypothetical protein
MRLGLFIIVSSFLFSAQAQNEISTTSPGYNDYFEIGLSGNYRKVHLSDDADTERAYDENYAYIASLAYYFREMTAIEFSYSQGKNKRYIPSPTITSTTTHRYDLFGLDLVFTFGKRTDTFIPYIKAGIGYFDRKAIDYVYVNNTNGQTLPSQPVEMNSTVVPSAGLGMQIRITQQLSFKTGVDFWTSGPIDKKINELDWAARVGISWFL